MRHCGRAWIGAEKEQRKGWGSKENEGTGVMGLSRSHRELEKSKGSRDRKV